MNNTGDATYEPNYKRNSLSERPASLAEMIARLQETTGVQMDRINHLEKLLEETREQVRSLVRFVGQDDGPVPVR
jgi:hypothetical protein